MLLALKFLPIRLIAFEVLVCMRINFNHRWMHFFLVSLKERARLRSSSLLNTVQGLHMVRNRALSLSRPNKKVKQEVKKTGFRV